MALAVMLALAVGYLGYRVVTLDHRLAAVNAQLGTAPSPASEAGSGVARAAAPAPATAAGGKGGQGIEPRIARLEHDLESLRADVRSLEAATETTLNQPPADPKQILKVVGSEVNRIRDKQLAFHKGQWIKWRRGTLAQFATENNLSDEQRARIDTLTVAELERWAALLQREDLADNPEQLMIEAREALRDTDEAARSVLNPEQHVRWLQQRAVERHTLWPFLPD